MDKLGGLLAEPLDSVARSAQDIPCTVTHSSSASLLSLTGTAFPFYGRMCAYSTPASTSLQSIMLGPVVMLNIPLQEDVPSCVFTDSECFGILSSCLFQSSILHSLAGSGRQGTKTESRQGQQGSEKLFVIYRVVSGMLEEG